MEFDYTKLVIRWIEIYGKDLKCTEASIENAKAEAMAIGFKMARPQVIAQMCLGKADPGLTFKRLNKYSHLDLKTYNKWMKLLV